MVKPDTTGMPARSATAPETQRGRLTLPPELVVLPWGERRDLAGEPVICNDTTLAELAANQERFGFGEVALDFDHNTAPRLDEKGALIPPKEPQPIAAMGALRVEAGRGVIFTPLSWTPEGEDHYTGRHYRDLSPTVARNEKGEVIFIHSVALTRKGQIADLHAFASPAAGLPALTCLSVPLSTSEPAMDPTTTTENLDWRALLAKALKLDPATASDEEIVAAADGLASPPPADAPPADPLAAAHPPVDPPASPAPVTVESLAADFDAFRRDQLVQAASAAGKVIPLSAAEIATVPLATLSSLIAGLPATAPLAPATPAPGGAPPVTIKPLSADEQTVARRMGYTPQQFRAANPG